MKVIVDARQYGQIELFFAETLCRKIRDTLQAEGVETSRLPQLSEALAFNVGALLDGCYPLSFQGSPLYAILTYSQQELSPAEETVIISSGASSDLHSKSVGRFGPG